MTFLLSKAEGVTRSNNKVKHWSRVQTRTDILDELNKANGNPNSTQSDIDAIEARLKDFDDLAVKDILEKHEMYRLLEDEKPTKRFLSCENKRAAYNNVSRLERNINVIDNSTSPPTISVKKEYTTKTFQNLNQIPNTISINI